MLEFSDGQVKTNVISQIYPLASGSVVYTSGKGAFGISAVDCPPNIPCPIQLTQVVTRLCNFWYQTTLIGSQNTIWQAYDSVAANVQVSLQLSTSGVLQLFRGATLIATSSGPAFTSNNQYHIEVKVTIDGTTGVCEVRVNGDSSPVINFSGNTKNTANTFTDQVRLGPTANTANYHNYYSHIVIYNTSGSAPTGFIGMKRIYTLMPNADSATGGLNQFSTSPSQSAGSHFNNVKETPPDDDTSYNFDSTTNNRESYRVAGLPASVANITVVNAFVRMKIDDAGPHTVDIVARNGSTDNAGSAQTLTGSYAYYNEPFHLDPNTSSAWTTSGFGTGTSSNAEFGPKVAS